MHDIDALVLHKVTHLTHLLYQNGIHITSLKLMIKIPNFKKIVYAYRNCSVIKLQVWLSPVAPPNMA
jgi:hypothetical protein